MSSPNTGRRQNWEQQINDEITCSICQERLNEPKTLIQCSHSFCQKCLEGYQRHQFQENIIPCPQCRKQTILPVGGVAALATNYSLKNIALALPETDHPYMCQVHNRRQEHYCAVCNELLCSRCIHTELKHKQHNTHLIEDVLPTSLKALGELQQPARKVESLVENVAKQLDKEKESVRTHCSQATDDIETFFNNVAKNLEKRKRVLLSAVHKNAESKLATLDEQRQKLDESRKSAVQISENIRCLRQSRDASILTQKQILSEQIEQHCESVESLGESISQNPTMILKFADDNNIDRPLRTLGTLTEYQPDPETKYLKVKHHLAVNKDGSVHKEEYGTTVYGTAASPQVILLPASAGTNENYMYSVNQSKSVPQVTVIAASPQLPQRNVSPLYIVNQSGNATTKYLSPQDASIEPRVVKFQVGSDSRSESYEYVDSPVSLPRLPSRVPPQATPPHVQGASPSPRLPRTPLQPPPPPIPDDELPEVDLYEDLQTTELPEEDLYEDLPTTVQPPPIAEYDQVPEELYEEFVPRDEYIIVDGSPGIPDTGPSEHNTDYDKSLKDGIYDEIPGSNHPAPPLPPGYPIRKRSATLPFPDKPNTPWTPSLTQTLPPQGRYARKEAVIIEPVMVIDKLYFAPLPPHPLDPNEPQPAEQLQDGEIVHPCGVATSALRSNIVATDVHNHCLRHITADGDYFEKIGVRGNASGEFDMPTAIAIGSGNDSFMYIVDQANKRIQKLTNDGMHYDTFGKKQLKKPWGITISPINEHEIYVSDADKKRVYVYKSSGEYLPVRKIGGKKNKIKFEQPRGIAFDTPGNLLVVDYGKRCIWCISQPENELVRKIGEGYLCRPCDVAVTRSGRIAITEREENCVTIFSPEGIPIESFGRVGPEPGMFNYPCGVCSNSKGQIVVADRMNRRLQVFQIDPKKGTIAKDDTD